MTKVNTNILFPKHVLYHLTNVSQHNSSSIVAHDQSVFLHNFKLSVWHDKGDLQYDHDIYFKIEQNYLLHNRSYTCIVPRDQSDLHRIP